MFMGALVLGQDQPTTVTQKTGRERRAREFYHCQHKWGNKAKTHFHKPILNAQPATKRFSTKAVLVLGKLMLFLPFLCKCTGV